MTTDISVAQQLYSGAILKEKYIKANWHWHLNVWGHKHYMSQNIEILVSVKVI